MPQYLSRGSTHHSRPLIQAGPVELSIVIDRSASMAPLATVAVAGFNTLLTEQKKLLAPTRFSLSLFSNEVETVHDGQPIGEVAGMEQADYCPDGGTALYDATGIAIEKVGDRVDSSPHPSRVLIAILTDGNENSSTRFSKQEIFDQICYRRNACGWQFLFMGVGSNAIPTGLSLGIQRSNIIEFGADEAGLSKVLLALSNAVRAYQLGDKGFALLLKEGSKT
jgi:hypothetical protein